MLTTLFAALALATQPAPAACPAAIVAGGPQSTRATVYRDPGLAARKAGKLRAGTRVLVCAERGGWAWILYAEGRNRCVAARGATCRTGWIDRRRLAATGA